MSFYEVKVVNRSGTVLATFDANVGGDARQKVTVNRVVWALNEPGSATISISVFHPAAVEIEGLKREVQIWRNGSLIFWGVPVQYEISGGVITWTCPGLLYYFTRLFFGPITGNYLTNGRFASNLTGWTAAGCTATHSTAVRLRGPGTARLEAGSSGDNFLWQSFNVDTGTDPAGAGLGIVVAALFYPASKTSWAFEERGLYVQAGNTIHGADGVWEPITMNHPVGAVQRAEVATTLLNGFGVQTVTVRLYAPVGAIHWGAVTATSPESLGNSPGAPGDLAVVLQQIIAYAQNTTTKSNLNIGYSIPNTGVVEHVAYQFTETPEIFAALQTYPARGICDFDIVCTSTTRTFTTYAPKKGTLKSANALTVPGPGVHQLSHRMDGNQTATSVVRRGEGSGSDREFGLAVDASGLDGLILQSIGDAPPEIGIDGLDSYAATDLAKLKGLVTMPGAKVAAEGWVGVVSPGDTVPFTIDWGVVQETVDRRVVGLSLDCPADTLDVAFSTA